MALNLTPSLKQHEAYQILDFELIVTTLLYGGAAGGGKSWLGCEYYTKQCIQYPGTRWFVGREQLIDLMNSTFVTFNKVWKNMGVTSSMWSFNGQYHYIQFANGSRIDFLDLKFLPSDPLYERYGSVEYTGGWIEEAGQTKFAAYDTLKSRVGRCLNDKYNIPGKILITSNPKKNWLYSEIYRPYKEGKLPPDIKFIQAFVQDNPNIESGYIKSLHKIKNQALKQRLLYGNWEYDDDPSALLEYDTIQDLFSNTGNPGSKYIISDAARRGSDRMIVSYWEGLQCMEIFELEYEIKSDITKSSKYIKDLAEEKQVRLSNILVDEDGVGGGIVDTVKCKGFTNNATAIQPQIAQNDPTKKLNYANLKTQCAFKFAELAESGEIGITEKDQTTKDLIVQELEQLKQADIDKDKKVNLISKDLIKDNIGRSPDFSDTLIMRMYYEIKPIISMPAISEQEAELKRKAAPVTAGLRNKVF